MTALLTLRETIQNIESQIHDLQDSLRTLRKVRDDLWTSLREPDYNDGIRFHDFEKYPPNIVNDSEVAEYVPYACHDPYTNKYRSIVEWEIDRKQGASDPLVGELFNTRDEAYDDAVAIAKKCSDESRVVPSSH